MAAVQTVTSNSEAGTPGTLRNALEAAQAGDSIAFALPAGSTTIELTAPLPMVAYELTIDADNAAGDVAITGEGLALASGAGLKINLGPGHSMRLASAVAGAEGDHGLTLSGGGVLILAGRNSYKGATKVNAGTLRLDGEGTLPAGGALVVNGGTFDLNDRNQIVGSLSGDGGTISLGSGTLTTDQETSTIFAGDITGTGGLVMAGSGRLTLAGAYDYTGGTTVSAGILELGGNRDRGVKLNGPMRVTGGAVVAPGMTLRSTP